MKLSNLNNAPNTPKHDPLRPVFSSQYLNKYGENQKYLILNTCVLDDFGGALSLDSKKGRSLPKIIQEGMTKFRRVYFNRDLIPSLGYHKNGNLVRSDAMENNVIVMNGLLRCMDLETMQCGFTDHSTSIFNHTPMWKIAKSCCLTYEREPGKHEPSSTFSDAIKRLKKAGLIEVKYRVLKDAETGDIIRSEPAKITVNTELFQAIGITSAKLEKARKYAAEANMLRAAKSPGKAHKDKTEFNYLLNKAKSSPKAKQEIEQSINSNIKNFTEFKTARDSLRSKANPKQKE